MKWLLLLLAIGLTASEKLDRTYLPPPGAQYAGGNAGDIQAPLELPQNIQHGTIPTGHSLNGLQNFEPNGPSTLTPVTTTSYAFTQTTTFPPIESYETTIAPINPITGLPVQNLGIQQYNQNSPGYVQNQGQIIPNVSQFPGQGGNNIQIPGSVFQQPINGNVFKDRQGGQILNQTPGQTSIYPGSIQNLGAGPQAPGQNQAPYSFSNNNILPARQGFVSTTTPQQVTSNNVPDSGYSGSQGPLSGQFSQGSYSGQPFNVQYSRKPDIIRGNLNENQQQSDARLPQPGINQQNVLRPDSILGQNIYQPTQAYNSISGTTPVTGTYASTISPFNSSIRPERPQAAADRNAVILSYENERTPNSYSYSYDTSNGIHADETGVVNDGTKAHGSYSYTGDDGKIYTVTYTADENGFQPHGDHIPTPPPIPEAIKEVIAQAARDKEAGIMDDGSYDENKYGDNKYHDVTKHHRPQTFNIKPISGINNDENYENPIEDQFTKTLSAGEEEKKSTQTHPSGRPFNKIITVSDNKEGFSDETPFDDKDYENVDDQDYHRHSVNSDDERPAEDVNDYQQNKLNSKVDFPGRRPISFNRIKDTMPHTGMQSQDTDESDVNPDVEETYDNDFDSIDSLKEGDSTSNSNKKSGLLEKDYVKGKISPSGGSFNRKIYSQNDNLPNEQDKDRQQNSNQDLIQQVDQNGYYEPTQTKSQQTEFPNRFNNQAVPSNKRPIDKSSRLATSARPFITPEVYNQLSGNKKNQKQPSTSLTPFMTSRVTTSRPFNENDDDQDNYNYAENNSPDQIPGQKITVPTRKTYQTSTSRPQYTRPAQKTPLSQKGTARPGQRNDYSITVTPGSTFKSTTYKPTENQRFGSTESPQRRTRPFNKQYQSTTSTPGLTIVNGRPVTQQESNYQYKENRRPVGSSTTPGTSPYQTFGSRIPSKQKQYNAQYYPMSTYSPTSTTAAPTTPKYQPAFAPSGIPGNYQPGSTDTTQTGYYYEPVQSQYSLTVRPQTTSGSYGVTTPGNYPTISEQRPINIIDGTVNLPTPGRPGTFILDGQGNLVPEQVTNRPYQTNYQYGSTTPANIPNIVTSSPEPTTGYGSFVGDELPGSQSPQALPGSNKYGTTPIYSTTGSPSTAGTTPTSFISTPVPNQSYAGYPSYSSTQRSYDQPSLVDGYGRPIGFQQQSNHSPPGTELIDGGSSEKPGGLITVSNISPTVDISRYNINNPNYVDGQTPNYPGYNNRPIVGEVFSGPKQPQSFDPQTGYHYK